MKNNKRLTPWQKRRPGWRKKKPGECLWSVSCKMITGGSRYCPKHIVMARAHKNKRRKIHRLLGFCIYCKERAQPGFTRCAYHLKKTLKNNSTWRQKMQAERGWIYKRVQV